MPPEPAVMPELRDLLPKPSKEEKAALKAKIKEEGQIEELVAWLRPDNTAVVIEGHTRLEIMKDLGIKPKFRFMDFKDIDEVKEWMYQNALGRRNLPPQWVQYLIGKEYLEGKKRPGEAAHKGERTSAVVAKKHGVSEKTVRRAAKIASAIDRESGGSAAKRATLLAKKKTKAKKSTKFDHKKVNSAFGVLSRGVDYFARRHDQSGSMAHKMLNNTLSDFWKAWEAWTQSVEEAK